MPWLTKDHLDRVIELARENAGMRLTERKLLLVMSRVVQRKIDLQELAQCVVPVHSKVFLEMVAPIMHGPSRYYRDRALIITMHLLGAHIASTTDFVSCEGRPARNSTLA